MLPTEDLFVYVYVLVDDAISSREVAIAPRPGPAPACTDAELLAIALVRHLLGRRSEAGFLAEVARDWAHLFPRLPHQSQANRRIRWLWGAFEQLRAMLAARLPADDCQQGRHHRAAGQAHLPGPRPRQLDRAGQRPGRPVRPRRRARRMVPAASGWPSRPTSAPGSSGPGASCPPP
jgi:hypothetical protein